MTRLIAIICYWLQLHRVAYFLNRKRKRIITFHNVLDDDVFTENLANGVSNSFSQFKCIVNEISKKYTFSNDLDDARTATITFDDGYINQAEVAGKWLVKQGIPAYIFVSGQLLDNNDDFQVLTIDCLLHWVTFVPNGIYEIDWLTGKLILDIGSDNRLEIWSKYIWPAYMDDYETMGKNLLGRLSTAYPLKDIMSKLPSKYIRQRLTPITEQQITWLKQKGWEIGWHTYSHYPLARLTTTQKESELRNKSEECSSEVLSFPYGGPSEVDAECLEIASALGYSTAVSNVIERNIITGSMFRPRMSLSSDKILLHFELSGLKHLLKYRELLPKI